MKPSSFILHPSSFRKGFSLPEVMFAIMILGIGFIMVAAMFPVAIRQSKDSQDGTTAAEIAKSAVNALQNSLNTATAAQVPFTTNLISNSAALENWNLYNDPTYGFGGSVIYAPDPRFAWTALYRRGGTAANPDRFVQVFIFVLSAPEGRAFTNADTVTSPGWPAFGWPNLWPRRVEMRVVPGFPDQVDIQDDTAGAPLYPTARGGVAENAFLLTEDGTIFRVSAYIGPGASPASDRWQLYPGQAAGAYGPWTKAWLVGRQNSAASPPAYSGTAQDVGLFTTYLRAN